MIGNIKQEKANDDELFNEERRILDPSEKTQDDFQPEENIMVCVYGPPPRKNIFRKLKDLLLP